MVICVCMRGMAVCVCVHACMCVSSVCIDIPEATVRQGRLAMERGSAAFLAKEYADALEQYTIAAVAVPESTHYRLSRAGVLTELGRLDEAVTECKRIVALGECAFPCSPMCVRARVCVPVCTQAH